MHTGTAIRVITMSIIVNAISPFFCLALGSGVGAIVNTGGTSAFGGELSISYK